MRFLIGSAKTCTIEPVRWWRGRRPTTWRCISAAAAALCSSTSCHSCRRPGERNATPRAGESVHTDHVAGEKRRAKSLSVSHTRPLPGRCRAHAALHTDDIGWLRSHWSLRPPGRPASQPAGGGHHLRDKEGPVRSLLTLSCSPQAFVAGPARSQK